MKPFPFPDRLDRYLLRRFIAPLAAVLAVLLVAQLLERLLRLIDLAVSAGAPLVGVALMAANLVPHYLGLALPMAFTVAIFVAAARLSDDVEIDVMLASGRSLARIAAPVLLLALLLVPANLYLFGQLQPLSRYGYHVALTRVLGVGWNAKVDENRFIDAGRGAVFSADHVDPDGTQLHGVFIARRRDDGGNEIITAASGAFEQDAARGLLLRLHDGRSFREDADGTVAVERFSAARIDRDLLPRPGADRARGSTMSEKTLPELWQEMHASADPKPAAEFHARLARTALLPLLPLLALPLGIASRRGRRTPGIVVAAVALLALNHALQFGSGLAAAGRAAPLPAVWLPLLAFGALAAWVFGGSRAWPADNAAQRTVAALGALIDGFRPRRAA